MKKYYLLSFFFSIISAESISQLQRCACQEYPAAICTFKPYCTWTGKQCLDLICSSLPQENCDAKLTEYKCIWNEQQNQCKEHKYKCSELSLKYCSQPYGPDCIANETTQQCVDYNCNDVVDSYYCDPKRCSYINDKCGDPVNQDCSGLETCDGIQFNGDGKICYLSDLGVCKQYSSNPQSCSEFNDSQDLCNNHSCTFDETNSICLPISCNVIKTETLCNTIEDDINKVRYICSWNEDSCQNALPEEQIQNYLINNCFDANYLMQIMRGSSTRSSICITRKSNIINHFYDYLYIYFMKIFYLISFYLLQISAETLNLLERCACQEFAAAICSFQQYCTWTGVECVDLICSSLPQRKCSASLTEYRCIWNEQLKECQDHQYICSELTQEDCPNQIYCMYANQKCLDFNCSQVDDNSYCDPTRCSLINNKCGDPVNQDCSGFETCDGTQYNGDGKICFINDLGVCKSYSNSPLSCSEFNDSKELCNNPSCIYDEANQICKEKSCSDFIDNCQMINDEINQRRKICSLNGNTCQAVDSFSIYIQNYTLGECLSSSTQLCTWDLDTQKCKQCTNVTPNPQFTKIYSLDLKMLILMIDFIVLL